MARGARLIMAWGVFAACGGGGGASPWYECAQFECAAIEVPVDWDEPDGATMSISAIRAPARDPDRRLGSILINNGGPGNPIVAEFLVFHSVLGQLEPDIVDRFDVVGFDPRGTGESAQVDCVDDATLDDLRLLDPTPDDAAEATAREQGLAAMADGCAADTDADLLASLHLQAVARDMDAIRAATGDETINYLGVSYGTILGAVYMALFPERVRAFVLDSACDPTSDRLEAFARKALGYERALDRFLADCGDDAGCIFHGGEGADAVSAAVDAIGASLETTPLAGDGRSAGVQDLGMALFAALRAARWGDLADALAEAESGDGGPLLDLADDLIGRQGDAYTGFLESYNAISCVDQPLAPDLDLAAFDAEVDAVEATSPRMAQPVAFISVWCVGWPVTPSEARPPGGDLAAPPALVVTGRFDPACPLEDLDGMLGYLGNDSHSLIYEGDGHPQLAHTCVNDAVGSYLVDPQTTPVTTCPGD